MKKTLIAHAVMAQTAALVCVAREEHVADINTIADKKDKPINLLATADAVIAKAMTASALGKPIDLAAKQSYETTGDFKQFKATGVLGNMHHLYGHQPRSGARTAAVPA